uniref:PHD-finger family protein n=1 Tax=Solanum tuberosum TaxID=4113 RepID=M1DDU0_SOLTU
MSSVPSEDQCRPESPYMHHKKDAVLDKREKKNCEVCGDFGIQEAIITCYQCKNVDVHQYCIVGYWEDAPMDWCCEECDIRKGVMFSPRGLENERFKGSKLHASAKICQSTVQPNKHCPGASTILEHRTRDVVNESRMMNSPMTHPCDPALVPSWKGSFDILGALELAPGIFQAHPPCRVSRKVYEFSGLLPDTLKLELVPRENIWPSLFDNHCPGKEDIGLYFFKSEKKRCHIAICSHDKSLFMVRALFQSHGEPKISNLDSFGAYRVNIAMLVVNATEA